MVMVMMIMTMTLTMTISTHESAVTWAVAAEVYHIISLMAMFISPDNAL